MPSTGSDSSSTKIKSLLKVASAMMVTGANTTSAAARRFVETIIPPERSEYMRVRLYGRDDEEDLQHFSNSIMTPNSAVDGMIKEPSLKSKPDFIAEEANFN